MIKACLIFSINSIEYPLFFNLIPKLYNNISNFALVMPVEKLPGFKYLN